MKSVLYLSGALRVSTREDTRTPGPRAHILGIQQGFRELGWTVSSYIAGDRHARAAASEEATLRGSAPKRVVQDVARLAANAVAFSDLRTVSDCNLIYERFATLQALGALQRRRLNAPWVLESNGLFFREAAESRQALALRALARKVELGAYAAADLVVVVSEILRQEVLDASPGIDESRIIVVPNGVDPTGLTLGCGSSAVGLRILFVGTLIEWQGVDVLLRAIALLPDNLRRAVELRVVGEGPARGALERDVAALGLLEQVRFLGRLPRAHLGEHFAWAYIGYAGHQSDGSGTYHSPLKLLEYAACGLAIVSTPSADAEALLGDGYPVKIVREATPASVAVALLSYADKRVRPGADQVATVRAEASWRGRVQQILEAVESRGLSV